MLNEIDGILQEIDKFKGSVQNTENFSKQLHKDLAIIENYTATLADYKRLLLSELEKNAQSGQKHIEAARQTLLLELGKITRSAEEANESLAKGLERLVNRKINLLLILSAVNTIGILLLFFLR